MPENSAEMFDRVRLMARIDTDWDLSDKDTAALRHVLAAAEAHKAIPGDSLSTTVEKLREACSGVRVEPEPEEPSAAEVIAAAEKALERLLPWALQAGANAEDALALCARWKEANGDGANTR